DRRKVRGRNSQHSDTGDAAVTWRCRTCGSKEPKNPDMPRKFCAPCSAASDRANQNKHHATPQYIERRRQKWLEKGHRPREDVDRERQERAAMRAAEVRALRSEGMTFQQVADAMGISRNAAIGLHHRAHK